jgi:hypothetical protein
MAARLAPRRPVLRAGFQKNPVSWWVILLCDVAMILSVSLVTLPLYALVAHTRHLHSSVFHGQQQRLAGGNARPSGKHRG